MLFAVERKRCKGDGTARLFDRQERLRPPHAAQFVQAGFEFLHGLNLPVRGFNHGIARLQGKARGALETGRDQRAFRPGELRPGIVRQRLKADLAELLPLGLRRSARKLRAAAPSCPTLIFSVLRSPPRKITASASSPIAACAM